MDFLFGSASRFRGVLAGVVGAILIFAGLGQAQEVRKPDCFVLSAGVDNYPNANRLQGCLADATNTVVAFQSQQGKAFGRVNVKVYQDGQATLGNILTGWQSFAKLGRPGDFMVLFLSGHGDKLGAGFKFLPYDFDPRRERETILTDVHILDAADAMARQGKKVIIIIDACFAGRLRVAAKDRLNQHRNPEGGGVVLLLSCSPSQLSSALGQYSAFARAFVDAMSSQGDLDGDGKVTLDEIGKYSPKRTYELLRSNGQKNVKQDAESVWSPSITGDLVMATPVKGQAPVLVVKELPKQSPVLPKSTRPPLNVREWVGSETLTGYGRLVFQLAPDGRAVMIDARSASEGHWKATDGGVEISFNGGRVAYTGAINGDVMTGTARSDGRTWNWTVRSYRDRK